MPVQVPATTIGLIALAVVFDFLNGFHDSSNIVATMISSRAIGPRRALLITAAAEAAGPFLFGVAVARTIGCGSHIAHRSSRTAYCVFSDSLIR